jgi:hypothetical protein
MENQASNPDFHLGSDANIFLLGLVEIPAPIWYVQIDSRGIWCRVQVAQWDGRSVTHEDEVPTDTKTSLNNPLHQVIY